MKQFSLLFFLIMVSLVSVAGVDPHHTVSDSIDAEALRSKATELQSKGNELKLKSTELKNLFEKYKASAKAKNCRGALKEALDGLDMAEKSMKDCEEIDKLALKVNKAKEGSDIKKYVDQMEKKVKNAGYFIQQSDDRKKETEFEMKGC